VEQFVMGMAHRVGDVLATFWQINLQDIFGEFDSELRPGVF
jgi:hypothetical protein